MPTPSLQNEEVLQRLIQDPQSSWRDIFPLIYEDIKQMAHKLKQRNQLGVTLDTNAIVAESYYRFEKAKNIRFESKAHFYNLFAQNMRYYILTYIRDKKRQKRDKGEVLDIESILDLAAGEASPSFEVLEHCLNQLEKMDKRKYEIVMLRFFLGLTMEEIAEILGLSDRTVYRDWKFTQAWLNTQITKELHL